MCLCIGYAAGETVRLQWKAFSPIHAECEQRDSMVIKCAIGVQRHLLQFRISAWDWMLNLRYESLPYIYALGLVCFVRCLVRCRSTMLYFLLNPVVLVFYLSASGCHESHLNIEYFFIAYMFRIEFHLKFFFANVVECEASTLLNGSGA